MVRIKGCNSDYIFDLKTQQIKEQSKDRPVYLKIFVCPNDMPSQVEAPHNNQPNNWCQGIDASCPDPNHQGHALIHLHEKEGIALVTQNPIAAKGPFVVQPNGEQPVFSANAAQVMAQVPMAVQPDGQRAVLQVTETAFVASVPGKSSTGQEAGFQISVSQQGIVLKAPNGAVIQLGNDSIEITPAQKGTVKINGNVEITGELSVTQQVTVAGKPLPAA